MNHCNLIYDICLDSSYKSVSINSSVKRPITRTLKCTVPILSTSHICYLYIKIWVSLQEFSFLKGKCALGTIPFFFILLYWIAMRHMYTSAYCCAVLGMEDEICPYATFHLLGFREEMDPNKAMQFQTFPHQNGHERTHSGTIGPMGPSGMAGNGHIHQRSGSQSMVSFSFRDAFQK